MSVKNFVTAADWYAGIGKTLLKPPITRAHRHARRNQPKGGKDVDVDGDASVPPLKMTVSQALSGSFTVFVGTIWVAPTAVTNGQTTGNLSTKFKPSSESIKLPV